MVGLLSYRQVKHREPAKMEVLVEVLHRHPWLDRVVASQFLGFSLGSIAMAAAVYGATNPHVGQQLDADAHVVAKVATD